MSGVINKHDFPPFSTSAVNICHASSGEINLYMRAKYDTATIACNCILWIKYLGDITRKEYLFINDIYMEISLYVCCNNSIRTHKYVHSLFASCVSVYIELIQVFRQFICLKTEYFSHLKGILSPRQKQESFNWDAFVIKHGFVISPHSIDGNLHIHAFW